MVTPAGTKAVTCQTGVADADKVIRAGVPREPWQQEPLLRLETGQGPGWWGWQQGPAAPASPGPALGQQQGCGAAGAGLPHAKKSSAALSANAAKEKPREAAALTIYTKYYPGLPGEVNGFFGFFWIRGFSGKKFREGEDSCHASSTLTLPRWVRRARQALVLELIQNLSKRPIFIHLRYRPIFTSEPEIAGLGKVNPANLKPAKNPVPGPGLNCPPEERMPAGGSILAFSQCLPR